MEKLHLQKNRSNLSKMHFSLFPSQLALLRSTSEITVSIAARGSGKTYGASHWLLKQLLNNPNQIGFAGSPSYSQTHELASKVFQLLNQLNIKYYFNRAPSWPNPYPSHANLLSVKLGKYPSYLRFATLDNYEAHRGISIAFLLIDEASLVKEDAYTAVLLPALRGCGPNHLYEQLLITTPRGASNWVSQLIERSDVTVIRAQSAENFIEFPPEKIAFYKEMMSDRLFRQEMLGEILSVNDARMINSFTNENLTTVLPEKGQLYLASDQNNSPLCSLLIRAGSPDTVVKEIVIPEGASVGVLAQEILRANPKKESLIIYGDRSGNNKTLVSNLSFYELLIQELRKLGISTQDRTNKKNPSIFESAEVVNKVFEQRKLAISNKCLHLIKDLEKAVYKPGEFTTDKKVYDPHLLDCLRYFAWCRYYEEVYQSQTFRTISVSSFR